MTSPVGTLRGSGRDRAARRHLISLSDLPTEDVARIVERGVEIARGGDFRDRLDGCVVGVYFRKTSTRTRTGFSSGALRLGADVIAFGPDDLQENTGEAVDDTGRVLSRMLDALVARTTGPPEELRLMAEQDRMAVVNAMTADEHPTQALADLTTMAQRFGRLEDLRVLYLGEGNNTASALALALSRFAGTELHLRTPPGYGVAADKLEEAARSARAAGATLTERHDLGGLPSEIDVLYTTRWQTTGTTKADENWREVFRLFQVDDALMSRYDGAVFMHDLPAHRGEEVTAEVLDGPRSIAFDQAENKLHSAMAVLEWCVRGLDA